MREHGKLVPLDGYQPPAEQSLLDLIQQMGDQARQQVVQCGQAFARRDVDMAQDLVRQDDVIDELNRDVSGPRSNWATSRTDASGRCT